MNLRVCLAAIIATLGAVDVSAIGHDQVVPWPQPEPVTVAEKAAVMFKPSIHITNGCHPYPAVNGAGETGEGLEIMGSDSAGCKGSGFGSQVYGRSMWYRDVWAIMYSWYFPKDSPMPKMGHRHDWEHVVVWISNPEVNPTILAVSPSAHDGYSKILNPPPETVDGGHVKVNYYSTFPMNHALESTNLGGEVQDLIMWEQMTDEARNSLNTFSWGDANVPMNDGNFESKLGKAWPWSEEGQTAEQDESVVDKALEKLNPFDRV
jgi:hypothetical protein